LSYSLRHKYVNTITTFKKKLEFSIVYLFINEKIL
jgi:hypothetical protein